jgi:hypothetical protein
MMFLEVLLFLFLFLSLVSLLVLFVSMVYCARYVNSEF